jgi:hypothetical protein
LLSSSNDRGLEERRVSGRSSRGWLGGLAAVMKEAGNLVQAEASANKPHFGSQPK